MDFVIFTAFLQTISVTPSMTRLYSRLLRSVKLGGTSITQASTLEDAHSNSMLESQQQDSTALREWEPANLKFSKHWFLHTLQGNTGTKLEGFYDLWSSIGLSENREPQYPGFVIQIAMAGVCQFSDTLESLPGHRGRDMCGSPQWQLVSLSMVCWENWFDNEKNTDNCQGSERFGRLKLVPSFFSPSANERKFQRRLHVTAPLPDSTSSSVVGFKSAAREGLIKTPSSPCPWALRKLKYCCLRDLGDNMRTT